MPEFIGTISPGHPFRQGDSILIRFFNSVSASVYLVQARFINADGQESIMRRTYTPAATGLPIDYYEPTAKSTLVSIRVGVSSGIVLRGQTWCEVIHVQGMDSGGFPLNTLLNGYPTSGVPVSYPGTSLSEPNQGRGAMTLLEDTSAAAGANLSVAFPTLRRIAKLQGVYVVLYLDNTQVGNRMVNVALYPNLSYSTNKLHSFQSSAYNEASGTVQLFFGEYPSAQQQLVGAVPVEVIPMPVNLLFDHTSGAGGLISILVEGIQANDQIQYARIMYESWVSP